MQRNNARTDLHIDSLTMLQETTLLRDRAAAIARDCLTHLDAGPFIEFIGIQIMRETPPIMFLRIILDYLHEPANSVQKAQQQMRVLHRLLPDLDTLIELTVEDFAVKRPDEQTLRLLNSYFNEVHGSSVELDTLPSPDLQKTLEHYAGLNAHMTDILCRQAAIVQMMADCVREWLRALEVVIMHTHISSSNPGQFVQNAWDYRL